MKFGPFTGKFAEAVPTMLEKLRLWEELVDLYEPEVQKNPDDLNLQIHLGTAQMNAGQVEKAKVTLLEALKKTNDAGLLNRGAYSLADAEIDLPATEQYARKSIALFASKSAIWSADTDSSDQRSDQAQMIATWDTLAWILCKENHLEEAEAYARASWRNTLDGVAGLHLGVIEEKSGHAVEALTTYEIALAELTSIQREMVDGKPDPDAESLRKHISQLKEKGVRPNALMEQDSSQKLRTLPVGHLAGKNVLIPYSLILSGGKLTELQTDRNSSAARSTTDENLVRHANFSTWTPSGSPAKILRKGLLNCHSGVCELVVTPL